MKSSLFSPQGHSNVAVWGLREVVKTEGHRCILFLISTYLAAFERSMLAFQVI